MFLLGVLLCTLLSSVSSFKPDEDNRGRLIASEVSNEVNTSIGTDDAVHTPSKTYDSIIKNVNFDETLSKPTSLRGESNAYIDGSQHTANGNAPNTAEVSSTEGQHTFKAANAVTFDCDGDVPKNLDDRCSWATACMNDDSHIPYEYLYFCKYPRPVPHSFALCVWAFFLCVLAGTLADTYLTTILLELVDSFKISEAVAGCTILAFANSSGDAILGYWSCFTKGEEIDLYLGDAIGAVSFLSTVVFGAVVLTAGQRGISLEKNNFIRDSVFLQTASGILMLFVLASASSHFKDWASHHSIPLSLVSTILYSLLVLLYCSYVTVVYIQSKSTRIGDKTDLSHPLTEEEESFTTKVILLPSQSHTNLEAATTCSSLHALERSNKDDSSNTSSPENLSNTASARTSLGLANRHSQLLSTSGKTRVFSASPCYNDSHSTIYKGLRPSVYLTRVGKRLMSNAQVMTDPKNKHSLMLGAEHSGAALHRLSAQLMPFADESDGPEYFKKDRKSKFRAFIYRMLNLAYTVCLFPWQFMWKLTVPSPDFNVQLMALYPFAIVTFIILNKWTSLFLYISLPLLLLSAAVTVAMLWYPKQLCRPWEDNTILRHLRLFLGICMALKWNVILVAELVKTVKTIGLIIGLPNQILGLTIVTWGNSAADLFANMAIVRSGHPEMGLAGCYGAAIFTSLFGIGSVGLTSQLVSFFRGSNVLPFAVEASSFLVLGCLSSILPIILIAAVYLGFHFKSKFGFCLIAAYIAVTTTAVGHIYMSE